TIDATAVGTGKDIYLEAMAAAASAVSNLFGGGDVTFDHHGGTVTKSGTGTATIDGLVLAGIQRHRSLTVSYSDEDVGACVVTLSDCHTAPVEGEIAYTTGTETVGTTILDRLAELETLLNEYDQDPVAKGAYQSEITFLENKLVALGLGTFNSSGEFVPGQFAGPTPAQAQALIVADQSNIGVVTAALEAATGVVSSWIVTSATDIGGNYTNVELGIEHHGGVVFT